MLIAMLGTMIGGHSALRDLAAIGALVATSVAYAPRARVDVVFREHLVDLWVMALVLVTCLPSQHAAGTLAPGSHGLHDHFSLPGGPALVVIVLAAWAAARLALARRGQGCIPSRGWSRASLVSGAIVAASLALMLAVCAAA
jgi:hypothetical protein